MLVKEVINLFRKYTRYCKELQELKSKCSCGDGVLSGDDYEELYRVKHEEYVRFMNSPVNSDILK